MGRAKISIKYIKSENSRKQAFKQRKHGLKKKVSEFCKKSGGKACLIVYDGDDNSVEPMTWPEDLTSVNSLLHEYQNQKIEKTPEIFDVKDYFENRKKTVEVGINKVRKDILNTIYPTWHQHFSNMEENQLRDFIATINAKIQACNHKISMLKNMQQSETSFLENNADHMQNMVQESVVSSHSSQVNIMHSTSEMHQHVNDISELVDINNHVDLPHNSSTSQLHDISEMIDFTDLGDWPLSLSSNQLSGLVEGNDQVVNPDYIGEEVDFTSLGDLPTSSSTNQLSQLVDLDDWMNQLDDGVNLYWASQPDQFAWNDLSFSSQNEQTNA